MAPGSPPPPVVYAAPLSPYTTPPQWWLDEQQAQAELHQEIGRYTRRVRNIWLAALLGIPALLLIGAVVVVVSVALAFGLS